MSSVDKSGKEGKRIGAATVALKPLLQAGADRTSAPTTQQESRAALSAPKRKWAPARSQAEETSVETRLNRGAHVRQRAGSRGWLKNHWASGFFVLGLGAIHRRRTFRSPCMDPQDY